MSEQSNSIEQPSEFTQTLNKIFRDYRIAMNEFNDAMKRRDQINTRQNRQTMHFIYLGIGGLVLVIMVLLFLTFTLTQSLKGMSEQIAYLNTHLATVSDFRVVSLEKNAILPPKEKSDQTPVVSEILDSVNHNFNQMHSSIQNIQYSVEKEAEVTNDKLASMTKQIKRLHRRQSETRYSDYSDSYRPRYSIPYPFR